ncbi:MAG TPA: TlpA disulfide reductase family protein [Candidatus Methylomirabilis sp.]|nr:TlpA disulfide reductase family protein [Candidatus Methylomirabilis sp.]
MLSRRRSNIGSCRRLIRAGLACLQLMPLSLGTLLGLAWPVFAATDPFETLGLQEPKEHVEAPDFTLPNGAGKKLQLKDFRGGVVFLNFFATWCEPCRLEMPGMERLSQAYKNKGLVVLAVGMHESAKRVRAFMQELKLSFPAVVDADGSVGFMYGIRPIPTTYLVARDGQILGRAFGARDWDSPEAHAYFGRLLTRGAR